MKQELKKDFQGIEEDLEKLQQVINSGKIGSKKKEEWCRSRIQLCGLRRCTDADRNRQT